MKYKKFARGGFLKMVDKTIGKITELRVKKFKIAVYLSNHAEKRLRKRISTKNDIEREVDEYVIASNILALGRRIESLCEGNEDVAIIDKDMNVTVVAEFIKLSDTEGEARIITIIDKTDIYVKEGTTIINL